MRLTLRTLLAYLDDILEPVEAKEIGAKIAESGYATSLVNKIKDVVRRRRISAPDVTGPGSSPDPNIVAEYLDNTLPPDSVADLERVCLESDSHLAEVAACHQVLTLVLGEPVEIPAGMRERMYALGAVAPSVEGNGSDAEVHVPKVAGVGAGDVARDTRPGSGEVSLEDRLPEALLPRKRSWTRVLPYMIGVLVIGLWGYLMFNDEALIGLFASKDSTPVLDGSGEVDLSPGPIGIATGDKDAQPSGQDASATEAAEQVAAIPAAAVRAPDLTMTPQAAVAEGQPVAANSATPTLSVEPEPTPAPDAVAATTKVMPQPDAFKPPVEEPTPAGPPLPSPWAMQDLSTTGILLQHRPADDDWFVLPRRSLIHPNEEVIAPQPFDATLSIGDGGAAAEVILRGGTRVRSLGSTDAGRFGFEVRQGQIVIRRKETAPADEPVSLQLVIRKDTYRVDLLEPGTVIGIEVIPILPDGEGDEAGATQYAGGIGLVAGAATVESAAGRQVELRPDAGWLSFSTAAGAPPAEPEPLVSLPNWLNLQAGGASVSVRIYAAKYENEFITDQPISQSIRPVVKDRRSSLSELATQTLALADRYPGLVDALGTQHEESRLAAIVGLKAWLPLHPDNVGKLQIELQDRFRAPEADAIGRLLWGYSQKDARNQVETDDLLNWLGHDEIAIRELAFYHVYRLTDRRYDYRPNDPAPQREASIKRWRRYVGENGALVGD